MIPDTWGIPLLLVFESLDRINYILCQIAALGLHLEQDLPILEIVGDKGVQFIAAAGKGIEEQVLGHKVLGVGYGIKGRVAAIHGLVHPLDEIHNGYNLADPVDPLQLVLEFVHGPQHRRVLDIVCLLPLEDHVVLRCAPEIVVQDLVRVSDGAAFLEVFRQVHVAPHVPAHHEGCNEDHQGDREDPPLLVEAYVGETLQDRANNVGPGVVVGGIYLVFAVGQRQDQRG